MMNLKLNVLSPKRKARLTTLVRFLFTKELLEFVVFTCALLAITHLLGWLVLTDELHDLAASSLLVNRGYPTINKDVHDINTLTKNISITGARYVPLSPLLLKLITTLPSTIKISSLSIDRASQTLVLLGTAETRDALLHFQTVMETLPDLGPITVPTSQLLQKANITFELHAPLKNFPAL